MSGDLLTHTNGPYLRIVLPDFEPDLTSVWKALELELEEGVERAEIVAPCYVDDECIARVRALADLLEARGVATIVEWQGTPPVTAGDRRF
jgi:hypothetical protein